VRDRKSLAKEKEKKRKEKKRKEKKRETLTVSILSGQEKEKK